MSDEIVSETEAPAKGPSFADLGLRAEVLRAVTDMGFTQPMLVQTTTLPLVREGRDIMVQSRTGSGKTAAFGIPMADGLVNPADKFVQAIVILPTRELALQVAAEIARICAQTDVQVIPVYGGAPMGRQIEQLKAGGQIVCGTPGRILDHLRRGTMKLDRLKCAVLDECDEMLSMGFQEDIEAILEQTPSERQTMLFSATVPEGIQRLSRRFMRNPEFVKLSEGFVGVHEIRHVYYSIPGGQREAELLRILAFENPERSIIFCNTREETSRLAEYLRKQGFDAEAISSDLSQADRERVMAKMRAKDIRFLVATDVAARGIDLENLPCVINFTIPESPEVYIHRTGRTGRAGRHGVAISLIGPAEVGSFYYIKLLYKIKPEERSLPSEAEIRSKREGERILHLRTLFAKEPGPNPRSLARRLMGAVDGEKIVAGLLQAFERDAGPIVARVAEPEPVAAPAPRAPEPREPRAYGEAPPPPREPRAYGDDGGRGRRDDRERRPRPSRDGRERERDRSPRPERPMSEARPEGPRPDDRGPRPEGLRPDDRGPRPDDRGPRPDDRGPRSEDRGPRPEDRGPRPEDRGPRPEGPRPEDRGPRPEDRGPPREAGGPSRGPRPDRGDRGRGGRPPRGPSAPGETKEFWEVWSEEVGRTSGPAAAGDATVGGDTVVVEDAPLPREAAPPAPPRAELSDSGQARLYLNLGRKDGASEGDVVGLLATEGVTVGPGDLDVMNTHTYVNVPPADAERLCAALAGKQHNGRALVCEPARPPRRRY
jgi:ATP-dependent RNA helicase DeaD